MKKIIFYFSIVVLFCVMAACSKGKPAEAEVVEAQELSIEDNYPGLDLNPVLRARLEALDTIVKIPAELTEDERIIYLENHLLSHSITKEELLALEPVNTLDPDTERYGDEWKEEYWTEKDREKTRLVNRFMRMHYVSMGDPMDELQWAIAVDTMLGEYAAKQHISKEKAMECMSEGANHLEAGTQYEMNMWCYVQASIAYYKTLRAYLTLIDSQLDYKKDLFYDEYKAWVRMNKARHNAYVNIRRAGDHYSALPMEYEGMYAAYADYRTKLLQMEDDILWLNKTYKRKHPVMTDADWQNYLDHRLFRLADDGDAPIIEEVDQSVREWIKMRQRIAKNAFSQAQESYENLTSDYYWVIIHEAEPMPGGYY